MSRPGPDFSTANGKPAAAARGKSAGSPLRHVIPDYIPFPVTTLPAPLADFVLATAAAIGCDEANVALPVLTAVAAAIGNTRQIRLKRGWTEPAVVWAALVGASGVRKSPPFRAAMRPLVEAEQGFREQFLKEIARYNSLAPDEQDQATAPVLRRVLTEDVTIESVATILHENPRGIINARDEIDDWFQGMTRYKGKAGGTDRGRWLKLSNADTLTVDRKTGEVHLRKLFIPIASCSICGTIQLGILAASLDRLARLSGLAARLLLAMPTPRRTYWSEAEVDPETEGRYRDLIFGLLNLTMTADAKGRPVPHILKLTDEAKALWIPFYDRLQDEKADAEPDIAAVLAKLEGYAARFALLHHVVVEVVAGRDALAPVGADSVRAGIELARWFAAEARRIYAVLGESDEDREVRELEGWVRGRPGRRCTPRDLQHSRGGSYPTADAAAAALQVLVDGGRGTWETTSRPGGGWARKEFVLAVENDADTCDTRPNDDADHKGTSSGVRTDTRTADPRKRRGPGPSVASVGVASDAAVRDHGPPPVAGVQATKRASVGQPGQREEEGEL